jgi:hypothetical protein
MFKAKRDTLVSALRAAESGRAALAARLEEVENRADAAERRYDESLASYWKARYQTWLDTLRERVEGMERAETVEPRHIIGYRQAIADVLRLLTTPSPTTASATWTCEFVRSHGMRCGVVNDVESESCGACGNDRPTTASSGERCPECGHAAHRYACGKCLLEGNVVSACVKPPTPSVADSERRGDGSR